MESTRSVPWWSQKTVSMISISVNGDANFFARGDECFQVMGAFFRVPLAYPMINPV
jgi:hypothetical protein